MPYYYRAIDDLFVPDVRLGFGSYQVSEEILGNTVLSQHTHAQFGTDCSGVIHPDETKTCTIANVFIPFG